MNTPVKQSARLWLLAALLSGVLLSSCGTIDTAPPLVPQPTSAPTSASTTMPTAVPQPTAASTKPTTAPQPTAVSQPTSASTSASTTIPTTASQPTAVSTSNAVLPAPLYFVYTSADNKSHIVRLERDGHTRTNIIDEQPISNEQPIRDIDISPVDGSLAYAVGSTLVRTDPDGKNRTVLFQFHGLFAGLSLWSPDGKTIAVRGTLDGGSGVYLISADGMPKLLQADDTMYTYWPQAWSPDSRRLLFQTDPKSPAPVGLAVKDLTSGTLLHIVLPEPLQVVRGFWTRDSSAVYVPAYGGGTPTQALWRVDVATGKTTPYITNDSAQDKYVQVCAVHPLDDGSTYAFLTTSDKWSEPGPSDLNAIWPRFALVHISSDGRVVQFLSDLIYVYDSALWATDNSGMLIEQYRDKITPSALMWQPADGGVPTMIVQEINMLAQDSNVLAQDINISNIHWGVP